MSAVIALKRGVSAEVFKFRRTFLLWFLILAPAFIPLINFLIFWTKGHELIKPESNAWEMLLKFSIDPGNMLFPFFVMIVALFVNSIEHNSNTWKLIYTQPISRPVVYLSKVIVFVLMLGFSLLLFSLFSIGVGYLVKLLAPGIGFEKSFDLSLFFRTNFQVFIATLGYASIQFAISQRKKNLILPLGIGIAGFISFMIVVQGWKYAEYHPYGYQILGISNIKNPDMEYMDWAKYLYRSLGLALVVFTVAGIDNARKRIV